ncbi:MAG: phytanoyl-CoA dioxygenase family protein [Paenibacillaceae bacterium]|nr:phytanoyl-CoA dioxygenase family protein [Paenibacillaceae bacterium]
MLSFSQVSQYERDGYIVLENVFSPEEVAKLLNAVEQGEKVSRMSYTVKDGSGKLTKLALWFDLADDIWSAASTVPRIVNPVRILLGEDASFFHGKVMLKEAKTGGAWEWHQDYGYWYDQGFMYPNLISAFTALDPATIENGCLRVLKGSHKLGRLSHQYVGTQTGADPDRMEQILSQFELVPVEMKPGSVLFFHSNLLHSSAANLSDYPRRSFIMCYNATSNPEMKKGELNYRPSCPVGPDNGILVCP